MVLPVIPVLAGLLGMGGGYGIASFLDSGKKEQQISEQYIHAPIEAWQYSPTQIFAPTTQYQIRSPGAQQTSKKVIETVSKPSQAISPTISPQLTAGKSELLPIVVIAVVGVIAYGYVSKGKGKKK